MLSSRGSLRIDLLDHVFDQSIKLIRLSEVQALKSLVLFTKKSISVYFIDYIVILYNEIRSESKISYLIAE